MAFYLKGKTIPGDTSFIGSTPHPTIEEAVEDARTTMSLGGTTTRIVDHEGNIIMDAAEVLEALKARPSN